MSRRQAAFLCIGLGTGLILVVVAVVLLVLAFPNMFIMGISWHPERIWSPGTILLALPFLLIITGAVMLRRSRIA